MRPRILQLINSFHSGGSERQALQLTRLLRASNRYQVHLACLDRSGVLSTELDSLGLSDILEFPITSFYDANCLLQLRRFARYLKQMGIALVHSHDFYTNIFGMAAARWANIPARVASRRETSSAMRSAAQRVVERCSYRMANAVLANCKSVAAEIAGDRIASSKVVVVHNGLDLQRFPNHSTMDRKSIAESLGISLGSSRRLVTLVANLRSEVKDHPTFLEAALQVRATVPDAGFVLAGEGELANSIQRLAEQLGLGADVSFIGRCDRIPELLAASEVCVLTSKAEGFPNVILEYMASSRPVVTTDVGGVSEAVIDGKTGFVVPVGNAPILAARVLYLLRNPVAATQMGELGRLRVEENFSISAQLEKIERLYDGLLAPATSTAAQSYATSIKPALGGRLT